MSLDALVSGQAAWQTAEVDTSTKPRMWPFFASLGANELLLMGGVWIKEAPHHTVVINSESLTAARAEGSNGSRIDSAHQTVKSGRAAYAQAQIKTNGRGCMSALIEFKQGPTTFQVIRRTDTI